MNSRINLILASQKRASIANTTVVMIVVALIIVSVLAAAEFVPRLEQNRTNPAYKVAFVQTPACSPPFWGVPWSVTVGGMTKVQPSNAEPPLNNSALGGTANMSLAAIDFFLPAGPYNYRVSPSAGFFTPSSGSFIVSGSGLVVKIQYSGTSCTLRIITGSPIPVASVQTASVSIGGSPRTIAVNPTTNRIYVADYFNNILTVVDGSSRLVVANITLPGNSNNGISVDTRTNMVYVLVEGGVAKIDGATNKVVGELHLDFGPGSLAYDQTAHVIYGSAGNGSLIGVDAQTSSIVVNVSLGYWANSVAVDPKTDVVFAAGCKQNFVCDSEVSAVNGQSNRLLNQVNLSNYAYPRLTVNQVTGVVFVSGSAQFVALNGTTGKTIYEVNSLACGPFDSMAVDTSSNQVLAAGLTSNLTLVYDGASGVLTNMYEFPSNTQYVAYDPGSNLAYVTISGQLIAFSNANSAGHVNSTLVGSGLNCPLP